VRRTLRWALVTTVATALVLVGLAATLVESPREREQVDAADQVARSYRLTLDRYTAQTAAAIRRQHDKDPDRYVALLRLIEKRDKQAPKISRRGTTAYGREHSDAYRNTDELKRVALSQFDELENHLRRTAVPDSRLIVAARRLLDLSPAELLKDDPVVTGAPLRDVVVPAYEKASRRLDKAGVPADAGVLAADLASYAERVISMTKSGAKKVDRGEPFFFDLGQADGLTRRLATYEALVQQAVDDLVETIAV
jgi:hypothetical protein